MKFMVNGIAAASLVLTASSGCNWGIESAADAGALDDGGAPLPTTDGAPGDDDGGLSPTADAGKIGGETLVENFSPPGGGLLWTCPDGTEIALSSEISKQSTLCLGIDGSECRAAGVPGPGDAECADPNFNGFLGTCVADYFSCFAPSGTCERLDNGNQQWSNGALQDRDFMDFIAAYSPSGASAPCITAVLGSGIVTYSR